ncbi:MAG: hypothetical protein WDO56_37315 [Gammaproteobacteria bacterium]
MNGRPVNHMFVKLLTRLRRNPGIRPPASEQSPYRAVSVVPTRASCPAAVAVREVRFLEKEAPTLPLPMCTWPLSCPCTFEHHADRRGTDRRGESPERAEAPRKERRRSFGRRITDQ